VLVEFRAGFVDVRLLSEAASRDLDGVLSRLRFVNLGPIEACHEACAKLPAQVTTRVVVEPSPSEAAEIDVVLCSDVDETHALLPHFDAGRMLRWSQLASAYDQWSLTALLLDRAKVSLYSPDGLAPVVPRAAPIRLELIGWPSDPASAQDTALGTQFLGSQLLGSQLLGSQLRRCAYESARSLPRPIEIVETSLGDVELDHHGHAIAPDVDATMVWLEPGHADFDPLLPLLDALSQAREGCPLFVGGLVVPTHSPEGRFLHLDTSAPDGLSSGNGDYRDDLVRRCERANDDIVRWCAAAPDRFYLDLDAIASCVGKDLIDATTAASYLELAPSSIARNVDTPPTAEAAQRLDQFLLTALRWVTHQVITLSGHGRIDAVVFDIDELLLDTLTCHPNDTTSWYSAWVGFVEAALMLKRRKIATALCCERDESWLRERWQQLIDEHVIDNLEIALAIDDFDAVAFGPSAHALGVSALLSTLGVSADHAVFVDADPADREEVARALPGIRVLGAELPYVRSELLYGPYTQRPTTDLRPGQRTDETHETLVVSGRGA